MRKQASPWTFGASVRLTLPRRSYSRNADRNPSVLLRQRNRHVREHQVQTFPDGDKGIGELQVPAVGPIHQRPQCPAWHQGKNHPMQSILEIKTHPWFASVNWEALLKKQYKAPFVPVMKSSADFSYYESKFTELPVESFAESFAVPSTAVGNSLFSTYRCN